jgi:rhodanese-related sulfurtransferase
MKKWSVFLVLLLFLSCKKGEIFFQAPGKGKKVDIENLIRKSGTKSLAEIYYEHGNFINSLEFPPVINAQQVYKHLNEWLIIDLRRPEDYRAGHISGAYNVPKEHVLDFLKKNVKAYAYPKIVFVCYSGQTASYVTGITRYAGFDNTYAMLFGMSAWNDKFSAPLKNGVGDRYPDMVEKGPGRMGGQEILSSKIQWKKLPSVGNNLPTILIETRAKELLAKPRKDFLLKADEFFPAYKQNMQAYYPICYLPEDKFLAGHIVGSHRFQPRKDLSPDGKLTLIPTDKKVLIYCKSGHTGGNAAAYLGMLGYDAQNLILGSMSFIYSIWKQNNWVSDVDFLINNFPVVEGSKRYDKNSTVSVPVKKNVSKPKIPLQKHKKKEVTGGCG